MKRYAPFLWMAIVVILTAIQPDTFSKAAVSAIGSAMGLLWERLFHMSYWGQGRIPPWSTSRYIIMVAVVICAVFFGFMSALNFAAIPDPTLALLVNTLYVAGGRVVVLRLVNAIANEQALCLASESSGIGAADFAGRLIKPISAAFLPGASLPLVPSPASAAAWS